MWLLLVPVCLAIFNSSPILASEPHYVIVVPTYLAQGAEEKACVTFLDLVGEVNIKLELKNEDQVHPVVEHKINTHDYSDCYTFQVPLLKEDRSIWNLHVSAHGEHINVDDSKKVVLVKENDVCIIQTDKSTYKPGDTVKFRLVTMNHNLQATIHKYPLVEIRDPSNQRIAQWLDVSTTQRIVDFSFHLADELALGHYKINIPESCDKSFKVDEYVRRRFELNIKTPTDVSLAEKSFHLDACGSYTYGKPVEGSIDISVCSEDYDFRWHRTAYTEEVEEDKKKCMTIKGVKTDSKGCLSREIELGYFNFAATKRVLFLEIKAEMTEESTGHNEKASANVFISKVKNTIEFVECDGLFQTGFLYHGKVKVINEKKEPVANEAVTVYRIQYDDSTHVTSVKVVTNSEGIAQFNFNTSDWYSKEELKARFSFDDHGDLHIIYLYRYIVYEVKLQLRNIYSKSESIMSIEKHSSDVSCHSEQSLTVEYDIHKKNLDSDTDHLHFFYFLMTKHGIFSYKEQKVDINDQANSPNVHGSFPLNFHVDDDFFPVFTVFVFAVLPNGETIARSTDYNVSPCVQNKMKLSFSEDQVRPGEHVSLEVTANPGSLCSVRSVDKGYLLENPHEDNYVLTQATENLRKRFTLCHYTYLTLEPHVHQCPENTTAKGEGRFDVHSLFLENNLLIFSNTQIKEPVTCVPDQSIHISGRSGTKRKQTERKDEIQKHFTRTYFPDTWLFELVHVGSDGHSVLNVTTPHSITTWKADGYCLDKTGIAIAKDVELTTFQQYFLEVIVPYSAVQGEKITIQAVVFSYVKTCILVVASLSNSEDLITAQDKDQSRCVCEGHSHSFSWDVSTLKPKALKIRVDSGAIEVKGECTEDALLIGDNRRKDSVEKTIVVKPRGYEEEDTKTFLLFPSDTREAIAININAPERLVPGSERAHIIVQGDLLANIIINMDNLLDKPGGCGEQNMAKFYQHVCTLEYLESIKELTPEIKAKIIEALVEGYQRQLTYRNANGSYSYFSDDDEHIWLTAFIAKGLIGAQKFIYINENHFQKAVTWLRSKQKPDGSFKEEGDYSYENEADNTVTRTAYITIALLEHPVVYNGSIVEDGLSYLKKSVDHVTSAFTYSFLAYVFTLSGDNEQRDWALKKLEESAIKKEGMKYWETDLVWKGEVETASYVVLALLSHKVTTIKDLEDCGNIVRWIVTNQNTWGGFFHTQDTTLALQALTKYAKAINNRKGDATVTITSKSGFQKTVHVDKSKILLVQTVDLPEVPGEYSLSVTGDGFVYAQSHLHYNVLPEHSEKEQFSFNISTEPSACSHVSQKRFDVHMDVRYSGKRKHTNMAIITVDLVSGYVADKDSVEKLMKTPLVEKTEITAENVTIYLKTLTHENLNLVVSMEREAQVENLQPANAVVYDYYDPEEYTVIDYSAPCSSVIAHCAVSRGEREDCGYPNISKKQCEQKGCCFDRNTPGAKWCFFQGFKKAESH